MTTAASVHDTQRPVTSTPQATTATTTSPAPAGLARRAFLTAAATAGAAAAIAPAAALAAGTAGRDPIFEVIERHRAASQRIEDWCDRMYALETELPEEKRATEISGGEVYVAEGDDPRWIAHQHDWIRLTDEADAIAAELVSFESITRAGAVAVLNYAVEYNRRNEWPEWVYNEDGSRETWHMALHIALAGALQNGEVSA